MPSREWVAVSTTSDPVQLPIHHATLNQIYFHVYRASINQTSTLAPGTYKFCVRIRRQCECEWTYLGLEGDGRDGIIVLHCDTDIETPEQLFSDPHLETVSHSTLLG